MAFLTIERPATGEFPDAFRLYVDRVPPASDLIPLLIEQGATAASLLESVRDPAYRYAPGKWSVREIVGHVADAERVFAYRLLCIARGETASLPGFNEDAYVAAANFERRPLAQVIAESRAVRAASVALLTGLDAPALARVGTANGRPISARALAYCIAGHEAHHLAIIRERYAPAF